MTHWCCFEVTTGDWKDMGVFTTPVTLNQEFVSYWVMPWLWRCYIIDDIDVHLLPLSLVMTIHWIMGEISFRDIESNNLCHYWKFLSRDEKNNIIKNQSILPVLQLNEHTLQMDTESPYFSEWKTHWNRVVKEKFWTAWKYLQSNKYMILYFPSSYWRSTLLPGHTILILFLYLSFAVDSTWRHVFYYQFFPATMVDTVGISCVPELNE